MKLKLNNKQKIVVTLWLILPVLYTYAIVIYNVEIGRCYSIFLGGMMSCSFSVATLLPSAYLWSGILALLLLFLWRDSNSKG